MGTSSQSRGSPSLKANWATGSPFPPQPEAAARRCPFSLCKPAASQGGHEKRDTRVLVPRGAEPKPAVQKRAAGSPGRAHAASPARPAAAMPGKPLLPRLLLTRAERGKRSGGSDLAAEGRSLPALAQPSGNQAASREPPQGAPTEGGCALVAMEGRGRDVAFGPHLTKAWQEEASVSLCKGT